MMYDLRQRQVTLLVSESRLFSGRKKYIYTVWAVYRQHVCLYVHVNVHVFINKHSTVMHMYKLLRIYYAYSYSLGKKRFPLMIIFW